MEEGGEDVSRSMTVIAVLALIAVSGVAWAGPSLLGPTGLLVVPTADVLGMSQWSAGASAVWLDEDADATVLYANVGLLPRLEIGFSHEDVQGAATETIVNAKYRALGLPAQVTVSVGGMDLTDQIDRSAYAVASHDLGAGILNPRGLISNPRVHAGVGSGRFDDLFAGFSVTVSDRADVLAEYDGDDINLGVRWPVLEKVELTGAFVNGLDDFAAGVSMSSPW
jgi:hypothetical protein